jgi:AAA15 family ATPase/GTPase
MLIRFYVANFLSFAEKTEFSMISTKGSHADDHVVRMRGFGVLRGAVLYGANASGKSNLVKAIHEAKQIITTPRSGGKRLPEKRFRPYSQMGDAPTHLEFEFSLGERSYAYGFSFTPSSVHEEWLYLLSGGDETLVFERSQSAFRLNDVHFPNKDSVKRLTFMYDDLLPDQLYLSEVNTRNIQNIEGSEVLTAPYKWFVHNLVVIFPSSRFHAWESIEQDEAFVALMDRKLRDFDTGINHVHFEERSESEIPESELPRQLLEDLDPSNDRKSVFIFGQNYNTYVIDWPEGQRRIRELCTVHETPVGSETFRMAEESDGTKRLTDFIPIFAHGLDGEKTFIVDEIDRSLHTALSRALVKSLFHTFADSRSQLIVTTHDTRLMDFELFRRDELWFVEKDSEGRSRLHSLSDYNPRKDLDVQKAYLNGRYGGIPVIAE